MDMVHNKRLDAETARDIEVVVVGFFTALDSSDYDRIIGLVTDDIEWVRPSGTFHGRTEVRKVLEARPKARATRHLVTNLEISAVGEGAAAAHLEVLVFEKTFDGAPKLPATMTGPTMLLSVDDHLVKKAEGGSWQISRKQATVVFAFKVEQ